MKRTVTRAFVFDAEGQRRAFDRDVGQRIVDVGRQAGLHDLFGGQKRFAVTEDTGLRAVLCAHFRKRLQRDFGADACGVAHGNANHLQTFSSAAGMRRCAMARRW